MCADTPRVALMHRVYHLILVYVNDNVRCFLFCLERGGLDLPFSDFSLVSAYSSMYTVNATATGVESLHRCGGSPPFNKGGRGRNGKPR